MTVAAASVPGTPALRAAGTGAGLDVLEVASAEPFVGVRRTLERRKAEGLHGGMAFTYRQPARSTDPERALPAARALVVGARSYLVDLPQATDDGPVGQIARYAWDDHYAQLKTGLKAVAALLKAHGWRARVLADDNAMVDRAAAHRAGIGWWGKSANLLLPGLGSWYVLGCVVTDAPLAVSSRPVEDRCGPCTRCLEGCPTGAITAPGVVDARRCLSWLLQAEGPFPPDLREALGGRIYGCDDCQEVCPPNRRAPARAPPARSTPRRACSTCSMLMTPPCSSRPAAGTSRGATCAMSDATPWSSWGTSATAAIHPSPPCSNATCTTRTPSCGATPSGPRVGSDARICSPRSSTRRIRSCWGS